MQIGSSALADLSAVSWVDWTAIAVLLIFAVLGLARGAVWQLTRAGILVLAYLLAIVAGPHVAELARSMFSADHGRAHDYVAFITVFLAVVVAAGVLAWLLQRMSESTELSRANRLVGAGAGVLTGGLIVLALLTGVQMLHDWTGGGAGVVRAAEQSRAEAVGRDVLRAAERALPSPWSQRAERWRELLDDPELTPRGTFRPLDEGHQSTAR